MSYIEELKNLEVKWYFSEFNLQADIGNTDIIVYRSIRYGEKAIPEAKINWPSIGAQDTGITEAFVIALQKAVEIAKEMNKTIHLYDIKGSYNGKSFAYRDLALNINQIKTKYAKFDNIRIIEIDL